LGVGPAPNSQLFIILSPVGPYYPEGFKPVKLFADEVHVRAWPGGTGDSKVGG
jgi:branched-chain amino acid aminotransferase